MGRSELTAVAVALACVLFGMGTVTLRDHLSNSHEEQMARIEVVRMQQASTIQLPEQIIQPPKVTRAALQRALKKNVGGPE